MQTRWSCLRRLHRVDRLTEMSLVPTDMNKNVMLDITQQSWPCQFIHACHNVLYLSKIKRWWWRRQRRQHGCWWPPRIAKLPALILDPHQQKWHPLYVCVGVLRDLQQNSISCLHLSRLIILCSISFKQETSHFLAVLWLYLAISKAVVLYCAARFQWRHTYFPPCFNFLSQSFKFGPFNPLKGKVTCEDRAQYYFRSPFLPPLPPLTPSPPNKERESRASGIY